LKTATVAVWAVIGGMLLGMWAGGHPDNLPDSLRQIFVADEAQHQSVSDQAAELIQDNYYRATDPDQVQDGSVDGMVRQLKRKFKEDRFSHYFTPKQNEQLSESLTGSFSGVGMTVGQSGQAGLEVGYVFRRSPAAKAGLKAGDLIVEVNGKSIRGDDVDLIVAKIKGPEGTDVTLGVRKGGKGPVRQFKLTREEIRVPITANRVREVDGRKLGYVQLTTFSQGAGLALRRATNRVIRKGAEGIVLDLRDNGGGLLEEAIYTSSVYLDKGDVVVETSSRSQGDTTYRAVGGNIDAPPIVVLVNRNTASAAEILSAALQTDLGTPVVGTRTYGKGLFQQVMDLNNGGSLDLSVGEFLTADGVSLAGKGLKPDVYAPLPENATRDVQLDKAFATLSDEVAAGPQTDTGGSGESDDSGQEG
jgi:carboxyl-terminal processing protease